MDPATTSGYGGVWLTGQPFHLNIKCILIGIIIACIYALPKQAGAGNLFMMAFIFSMSYIGISIYDKLYHCEARLFSGSKSTTGIFKPQDVEHDKRPIPPGLVLARDQELAYRNAVYSAHFTVLAPLILVSTGMAMNARKKDLIARGVPEGERSYGIYPVVFGLGLLALFYHGARLIWPRDACKFA